MTDFKSEVRRHDDRASYDRTVIDAIIDEALHCHVGFVEDGHPYVIPTIHARIDDTLYFHGSPASRMLRLMKKGAAVCVTVTLVDGLVVAATPFNQSLNYRSAIVFGEARVVDDRDERLRALRAVTEHVTPGRWDDSRATNEKEIKATLVVAVDLAHASAKIRTGPPVDDPEDVGLAHWTGLVPLSLIAGEPIPADGVDDPPPGYLTDYRRGG